MKYREGQWAGYSYAWDEDGGDARLVPEGGAHRGASLPWSFPSRANCLGCHNRDRGLGLEVGQLEGGRWPGGNAQPSALSNLEALGLLEGTIPPMPPLARLDGPAPLERRARAYLHANCAICHTRDGPTPVDMDLRYTTPLAHTRLCGALPSEGDLGVAGAARLSPGEPSRSVLSLRMKTAGRAHMPPIGPQLVDDAGVALVEAWIEAMRGCP